MDPIYDGDIEELENSSDEHEDFMRRRNDDTTREDPWIHKVFDWSAHVKQLLHEKRFNVEYRMSVQAFTRLRNILYIRLRRQIKKKRKIRPVTVEMIIGSGLRFLAGGKVNDIRHIFFLSKTECYHSIACFIKAVNTSNSLNIKLPQTAAEWEEVRKGFANKSSNGLMNGCVGAIDGFLQPIIAPWKNEVGNVRAYFSGHYQSFGLNCQAACDKRLKFLYFGIVAPGKTNDNAAYPLCTILRRTIKNLPVGLYFVGDAAYSLEENLLVPFVGSQKMDNNNDAFNFHLSQMRIRIEMAFGRLVRKFQILKRKIEGKLGKISQIISACARLHNFIIDMDVPPSILNEEEDDKIVPMPNGPQEMGYLPTMLEDEDEEFEKIDGTSETRTAIVDEIKRQGIRRPDFNIQRKITEKDELMMYYHPT